MIHRIILILLLFATPVMGMNLHSAMMMVTKQQAVSCTTADDSEIYHPVSQDGTGYSTLGYAATKVTLSSATMVTTFLAKICDIVTTSGTVTMLLYSHNAGSDEPDDAIADTDSTVSYTEIADCDTTEVQNFDLGTPKLVSAGTYWIVSRENADTNRRQFYTASVGDRRCYSSDGTSWTCTNDSAYDMEVWGCQ